MARLRPALATLSVLALTPSGVRAADRPLDLAFNLGGATDYVFRGVSQTGGRPQAFAGADASLGRLGYAGAWVSNVRLGGESGAEYDLYAGARPNLGPVALDLGLVRYGYTRQPATGNLDFVEFKALASLPLGPANFGAGVYHAAHYFGRLGAATYYELNADSRIPGSRFSVSGAVGREQISRAQDYTTWNLGVGYAATEWLGFDLRYWDTGQHALGDAYKSRIVLGLKAAF
jgi:uncharacterized protein (TIGR02001 family)